ncbi:MAG: hypothetical protein ABIP19_04250 [Dermatophilaceae bacterium]
MATILVVLGGVASAAPAWAHGAGETEEGYLLVQQALGHLAHEPNMAGVEAAMEKIDDTLATTDQEGVNVAQVKEAQMALDAGKVEAGQALLQKSITEAVSQLKPATGEETGTTLVPGEFPGRGSLNGLQWAFLGISVLLLLAGSALASRFRPADNLAALRRRLAAPQPNPAPAGTLTKDQS